VDLKKRKTELRLDNMIAREIFDEEARKVLMNFVSISRTKSNRLDAIKEIKNMVLFSEIVVSPLILGAMYEKK
jgi:hypothetical protein